MKKSHSFLTILLLVASCSGLPVDTSMPAAEAGDLTIALSACGAVPGRGLDLCTVSEGTRIQSSWRLILPNPGKGIRGGDITVYYRDIQRSYKITGPVLEIPWSDIMGVSHWQRGHSGQALALATIRYEDPSGLVKYVYLRGKAEILVTKAGYERMPIDSEFVAWETQCKIQYSTSGRSAVKCK